MSIASRPATAGAAQVNVSLNANYNTMELMPRPKSNSYNSNAGLRVASRKALLKALSNKGRTRSVAHAFRTRDMNDSDHHRLTLADTYSAKKNTILNNRFKQRLGTEPHITAMRDTVSDKDVTMDMD